ncbi:MAG: type II toxin-antitoxin system RelE/ParE family toxin [Verrucomicrobiota bacterium]
MASYRIEFTHSAERDLRRLDRSMLARVMAAIDALSDEPRPSGVKKLVGSELTYRIRVGDYRVVYSIEDRMLLLLIQRIRHRSDVYR